MYQKNIFLNILKTIAISWVLGTLPPPLLAMEQGPNEQERKTISKQIASHADDLIKQWKQQGTKRIIIAGHTIDPKQEKFIAPLVNKIVFHGFINTPKIETINLTHVAAFIMRQIGAFANEYNQDGSGLMIVYPAPKDSPRVYTFEGSSSTDEFPILDQGRFGEEIITCHFENKIVFSKEADEKLDKISKNICAAITDKNNFDFLHFKVGQEDLPPHYTAETKVLVTRCYSPLKLKRSPQINNGGVVLENTNTEKITIGGTERFYFFDYYRLKTF